MKNPSKITTYTLTLAISNSIPQLPGTASTSHSPPGNSDESDVDLDMALGIFDKFEIIFTVTNTAGVKWVFNDPCKL